MKSYLQFEIPTGDLNAIKQEQGATLKPEIKHYFNENCEHIERKQRNMIE
jgi:serine/threonine protein kinase HipA of HipAB toxin-antitoxin module